MAYIPLGLEHNELNAAIAMFTEGYLEQAHHLLAATYPGDGPFNHFGQSAAVMTLLAISAASRLRIFDPVRNDKRRGTKDGEAFVGCVREFFPWSDVAIEDDQYRTRDAMRDAAATELYKVFRNPLVHSGGVTGRAHLTGVIAKWHRTPKIAHVFPGLSPAENEQAIEDYCNASLSGDKLIELEAFSSTVHTRPLYWCTRKMILAFAADADVQRDIAKNIGSVALHPGIR